MNAIRVVRGNSMSTFSDRHPRRRPRVHLCLAAIIWLSAFSCAEPPPESAPDGGNGASVSSPRAQATPVAAESRPVQGDLTPPTPARVEPYPIAQPLRSGHLSVGELHRVYYEVFGNPNGKPVFALHGGPGVGSYPLLAQYFNPEKYLIVLHDQRGSGRSTPPGETRENTTADLVADIQRLREHLNIHDKIVLSGGSWGSTLALAYAETHPEAVAAMILRGIWLAEYDQLDNGYGGGQARLYFPEAVARLEAAMPAGLGKPNAASLGAVFNGEDEAAVRRVSHAWLACIVQSGRLHATAEELGVDWSEYDLRSSARIDCHYGVNRYFLEDGQLLRDAGKLADIPAVIINGRYDVICPPVSAWRLHQRMPKSKLVIVEEAGHSETDGGIARAIIEAAAEFE
jgi:proline iminopeptidase